MNADALLLVGKTLAMLVSLAACASVANAEDLLAVYRSAQDADTTVRAARQAYAAARERLPQARAGLLPTLNLNAGANRQNGHASFDEMPTVARDVRSWNWTLQATQPLWRPGNWRAYTQAHAQLSQAEEVARQAEQDLMLRVSQAYFDVLVATEGVRVARLQQNAVAQQLALASRNFEVGTGTVTDVHEARARMDLSHAQRVAAENDHELRTAELERLLGRPVEALSGLREGVALPQVLGQGLAHWLDMAGQRNPAVLIQQASLTVAEHEIARQSAAHSPSLDLTVSQGRNYTSGSISSPADISSRGRYTQLGLNFVVPLYAGGATQARIREAIALREKSAEELEGARRQSSAQARQAYSGVLNGHAQVQALESAVRSSKNAVESNRIGYRIGTRINIDVLNADQQLYAAQRDLTRARADVLLSSLRLRAAVGELTESDLAALSQLLTEKPYEPP